MYAKQQEREEKSGKGDKAARTLTALKIAMLQRQIQDASPDTLCMRIQCAFPPRGPKTGPPDLRVELAKNSKRRQLWARNVANNSKGSKAGLSMGEVRLSPLSSIRTEGEQEGEQQERWLCDQSTG